MLLVFTFIFTIGSCSQFDAKASFFWEAVNNLTEQRILIVGTHHDASKVESHLRNTILEWITQHNIKVDFLFIEWTEQDANKLFAQELSTCKEAPEFYHKSLQQSKDRFLDRILARNLCQKLGLEAKSLDSFDYKRMVTRQRHTAYMNKMEQVKQIVRKSEKQEIRGNIEKLFRADASAIVNKEAWLLYCMQDFEAIKHRYPRASESTLMRNMEWLMNKFHKKGTTLLICGHAHIFRNGGLLHLLHMSGFGVSPILVEFPYNNSLPLVMELVLNDIIAADDFDQNRKLYLIDRFDEFLKSISA